MDNVTSLTPRLGEIAGFWRRLFAFFVDGLVLGALGLGVGLVAHDRLVALGDWGRAVGFVIALVYFATLDSALSGGRSPGKRLLGIQVVNADGMPLSLGASTVRASIFCVPYFLNGAVIDASGIVSWLLAFLVFGVGFSITYLLLFNRRTRQSLHDLAVGAYVVTKPGYFPGLSGRVWFGHFVAVGLIVLTGTVALPLFAQRLARSIPFATLQSVQQALQQDPDVRHASALVGVSRFFGKDGSATTTHVLTSDVVLSRRVTDLESTANRMARIILDHDPSAAAENEIAISVRYGYDIGIASAWQGRSFSFSPEEWRRRF